jgi:hypothetical protein
VVRGRRLTAWAMARPFKNVTLILNRYVVRSAYACLFHTKIMQRWTYIRLSTTPLRM